MACNVRFRLLGIYAFDWPVTNRLSINLRISHNRILMVSGVGFPNKDQQNEYQHYIEYRKSRFTIYSLSLFHEKT